jgi:pilus assembly protein Flp/PilA
MRDLGSIRINLFIFLFQFGKKPAHFSIGLPRLLKQSLIPPDNQLEVQAIVHNRGFISSHNAVMPNRRREMKSFVQFVRTFAQDESGQDLIEYALVAGLIGLGAVTAMTSLSSVIGTAFSTVGSKLTSAV